MALHTATAPVAFTPVTSPAQVAGDTPDVLTQVLTDSVNLAVWQRRLPMHVADFARMSAGLGEPLQENRIIDCPDGDVPALEGLAASFSDVEGYSGFVADVAWLIDAYVCLTGAKRVGLRLRILDTAMCPRFHVDWVSLRLITTYAGAGSEWLAESALPRTALRSASLPSPQQSSIQRLEAGDVAIFKGERWEGNEGRGIIHRSPGVVPGERRLIMTLDWLQ